ncbi:hypothetical protein HanPI659440_Chr04g0147511 [Helianthus annuus]|nr:hypothetical protein HanPI659440_Chr04g0147511 [Helianthus annuus]
MFGGDNIGGNENQEESNAQQKVKVGVPLLELRSFFISRLKFGCNFVSIGV